jgi:hypothetical protein
MLSNFMLWLATKALPAGYHIAKMPKTGAKRKPRAPKEKKEEPKP